jgi:hypothetical protein
MVNLLVIPRHSNAFATTCLKRFLLPGWHFPGACGPPATFPGGSNTATIDASGQAAITVAAKANRQLHSERLGQHRCRHDL